MAPSQRRNAKRPQKNQEKRKATESTPAVQTPTTRPSMPSPQEKEGNGHEDDDDSSVDDASNNSNDKRSNSDEPSSVAEDISIVVAGFGFMRDSPLREISSAVELSPGMPPTSSPTMCASTNPQPNPQALPTWVYIQLELCLKDKEEPPKWLIKMILT